MGIQVLIVEDEELVREGIVAFLEDEGLEPTAVTSGEEAVGLLSAGARFQVCVVDMRLPGINGHQTMQALHRIQPDLPYIVHTGSVDYAPPPEIVQLGIDTSRVLRKPVLDLGVLVNLIKELAEEG